MNENDIALALSSLFLVQHEQHRPGRLLTNKEAHAVQTAVDGRA